MSKKVSVIIPAYNEANNILNVVEPVLQSHQVHEVICVNDGSTDNTEQVLIQRKGIKVISLDKNYGKSFAIAEGLKSSEGDIVILLDADLIGIKEETLSLLLNPLFENTHDCVVGYASDTLDKFFIPISGQRAYFRRDLIPLIDDLRDKGYGLELFLNFSFRYKRVKTLVLDGVSHLVKHKKHPLKIAFKWYISEIKELLTEVLFQENPVKYFANTYIYPFYLQRKEIRVLYVFDSISPIGGGSQVAAIGWMKNLQRQGVIVKMLCNKNALQLTRDITEDDIIPMPYLNLSRIFPFYYPTFFLNSKVKQEIKRFAPDIIHFHESTILAFHVMSLAKKNNIPTIYSFQTDLSKQTIRQFPLSIFFRGGGLMLQFFSLLQFRLSLKADLVLSLTDYYQKELANKLNKKVYTVPPPIQSYFFKTKMKKEIPSKLLVVGRLIQAKHVDVLIKMMKYLEQDFHLTLIGDGPDKKNILGLIKKLKLERNITYKQWVSLEDLAVEFSDSDLYLSASDSETFGMTYISALAGFTPCVVYDYSVSREVIPENTAIFISSLDPVKWAEEIGDLKKNPDRFLKLQENISLSYAKIKKFDEVQSTENLLEVYKKLLKRKTADLALK